MSWSKSFFQLVARQWQRWRLNNHDFDCLFDESPEDEYVCFDCETTGLNPKKDKILTLSAVKIKGNEVLTAESLDLIVKPTDEIDVNSIKIHQLRHLDVAQGVDEREAIGQFLQFIGSRPLVGYYLEFDVAMVNSVIKPWLNIRLPNPQLEVSELFYDYRLKRLCHSPHLPNIDLSFEHILEELKLPNFGQHSARNDAIMTALVFLKLKSMNGSK